MATVVSPNDLRSGPLLAIETSTRAARLGIFDAEGRALALAEQTTDRHAASLLQLCDQLFKQTQLSPVDLAAIACGAGPGNFTGLRVGMSLAKGFALPFATPLVLVSSLQSLALDLAAWAQPSAAAFLVPCMDAGKGEVHAQLFSMHAGAPHEEADPWRLSPEALCERVATIAQGPLWLGGPALQKFPALCHLANTPSLAISVGLDVAGPSAISLAVLARKTLACGEIHDLATAAPTYGRLPDITQPKRKIVGPEPSR